MKAFLGSLHGRISLVFLLVMLTFGLVQLFLGVRMATHFAQESDQRLYQGLAGDLAKTFQPRLQEGLDNTVMRGLIHDMMVYNPRVEIYLLDDGGKVLSYYSDGKQLESFRVSLEPVLRCLEDKGMTRGPVLGDDPKNMGVRKPFSVAPIRIGEMEGYLYLILGGELYDSATSMVGESYILRGGLMQGAMTLTVLLVVGLAAFFLLSRRLRGMVRGIRAFQAGDHTVRLETHPSEEIGGLGRAFNDMAEQVERHIWELKRSENLRRELVANISHDLRSPLSSIQGYLETLLLKGDELTREQSQEFLAVIHNNVAHLNKLVAELFELSKLEARQVEPHPEPFSLPELVQDVLIQFRPKANAQEVALVFDEPGPLPMVRADIAMIERVLSNLLDNAIRHTPKGGTIRMQLDAGMEGVGVRVSDSGYGIQAEDLPHVFERFYRADKARSRTTGGSGIGLAITKCLLDLHHAPIAVESAPDVGTTFTFRLPTALAR